MSADNTIAILVSPVEDVHGKKIGEEARVIHALALDNICYENENYPDCDGYNPEYLVEYFGNVPPLTVDNAKRKAFDLYTDIGYVEYGINILTTEKPFAFYRDKINRKE